MRRERAFQLMIALKGAAMTLFFLFFLFFYCRLFSALFSLLCFVVFSAVFGYILVLNHVFGCFVVAILTEWIIYQ